MKRLIATALVVLCAAIPFATIQAAESSPTNSSTTPNTQQTAGKLNINIADAGTIAASLKGIGLKKANAIVAYRDQLGGRFSSIEQLLDVRGIGERTLEKLKPQLTL